MCFIVNTVTAWKPGTKHKKSLRILSGCSCMPPLFRVCISGCSERCHGKFIRHQGAVFRSHDMKTHLHSILVGLHCQLFAQGITVAAILCKYSRQLQISGACVRCANSSQTI